MTISIHESQTDALERYAAKGYVTVPSKWANRVELANPDHTCLKELRGSTFCLMDKAHRGRHSSVVFWCDVCGKARRGQPYFSNEETTQCFFCVRVNTTSPRRLDYVTSMERLDEPNHDPWCDRRDDDR